MSQALMKRTRLSITITPLMMMALGDLAERTDEHLSSMATLLLRQALHQTMQSDRVQERYRAHKAQRNHAQWADETPTEHMVETAYAQKEAAILDAQSHTAAKTIRRKRA